MRTRVTVWEAPRLNVIDWPSPLADQRVVRLLSTALAGTFPSFVLAEAPEPPGVISESPGTDVGVAVGVGVAPGVVGVGVGVAVGGVVGVAVGPAAAKILTSVTL